MRVAVRTFLHRVMKMKMVSIIVRMGVFVRKRFVMVQMAVRFGQMQRHPCQHDAASDGHAPAQ